MEIVWKFFGHFLEDFWGILWAFFGNFLGIDLFDKVLVFVKILSKWRRKEGRRISILRSARSKLIELKNVRHKAFLAIKNCNVAI